MVMFSKSLQSYVNSGQYAFRDGKGSAPLEIF